MSENEQVIIKLLSFYSANTLEELILAQNKHIERLQQNMYNKSMPFYGVPSRVG